MNCMNPALGLLANQTHFGSSSSRSLSERRSPRPPEIPGPRSPGRGVAVPVALVLPTSLCSSQVARLIVEGLGREAAAAAAAGRPTAVRYVTLPHTEGCGYAAEGVQDVYGATLVGHLPSGGGLVAVEWLRLLCDYYALSIYDHIIIIIMIIIIL